ncbi:hypothetical protein ACE1CD_22960 [Aerosakkonema sp. BLCC-F183]|uniref:hypothetical protein n=1 Tax=Aerosakkonema sp. BLCC-F183 TaxID=3342834 RepID=UPI0035B7443A
MSEIELSETKQLTWQDTIDRRLQQRLLRPLVQPGLINTSVLAEAIIARSQQLNERLPLLGQINERWSNVTTHLANDIPLVYAHPFPNNREKLNLSETSSISNEHRKELPIIQAKFVPGSKSNLIDKLSQQSLQMSKVKEQKQNPIYELIPEALSIPIKQQKDSSIIQAKFIPNSKSDFLDIAPRSDLLMDSRNEGQTESLVYIGSNSRNLENNLQPDRLTTSRNLTSNLELSKISANELPVVRAKLDSPIQSPDISDRDSRLPLVKLMPKSISQQAERTAPLLNQVSVDHNLTTDVDRATVKDSIYVTKIPTLLLKNQEKLSAKVSEYNKRTSQPLVTQNIVPNWQGLDSELLLSIPPLTSYKTVANNGGQDLVNKQYNLEENAEPRKPTEVAIARTVTHLTNNNSASSLPNSSASAAIQAQHSSPTQTSSQTQIDLDSLADKVERKLIRRIAIESERRGQKRWR